MNHKMFDGNEREFRAWNHHLKLSGLEASTSSPFTMSRRVDFLTRFWIWLHGKDTRAV